MSDSPWRRGWKRKPTHPNSAGSLFVALVRERVFLVVWGFSLRSSAVFLFVVLLDYVV